MALLCDCRMRMLKKDGQDVDRKDVPNALVAESSADLVGPGNNFHCHANAILTSHF